MVSKLSILLVILCLSCNAQENNVYYYGRSEEVLDSLLTVQIKDSLPLIKIAEHFAGFPYKSNSLEITGTERLVVDLTGFDCVTLVENCIALKKSGGSKDEFLDVLRHLRYRRGMINGYLSRLHYFSEWISNADQGRLITDITSQLGGTEYTPLVNYMSANYGNYQGLVRQTQLDSLRNIEHRLSKTPIFYIPKSAIGEHIQGVSDGNIIAIVTSINGLDITHVGFADHRNDTLLFFHASSQYGEIILSHEPLSTYLSHRNHMKGVMILNVKK